MSGGTWAALLTSASLALTIVGTGPPSTPVVPGPVVPAVAYASPAVPQPTWGPAKRFETAPFGQSMVADARGGATVVWGSQESWPEPVKAARRTAAGRWREPVILGVGYNPVIAADEAGNLLAAWCRDRRGRTTGVWASWKPAGRRWTAPVQLSQDEAASGYPDGEGLYGAKNLDAALRPDGTATVTWEWGSWERDVPFRVQAAHRPAGGSWQRVDSLTPRIGSGNARAAVAPDGGAWVAYEQSSAAGPAGIIVVDRTDAGGWSRPRRVGTGSLGDLIVTDRGDVVVILRSEGRVRAVVRSARTGTWRAPVTATPPGVRARVWSVALNRTGVGLVTYLRGGQQVEAVRRRADGRWIGPSTLASSQPRLSAVDSAVNDDGDMYAGWNDSYGMWGRYRPVGGGWHALGTAQADTGQVDVIEDVQTAVTRRGHAVLLWAQEARPLRVRVLKLPPTTTQR